MSRRIDLDRGKVAEFCRRWKITELSLFGSVLRDDFRPDSDIDVMVSFSPDSDWTLFDLVQMQFELEEIFARPVDLVTRRGIEQSMNPFRRKAILSTVEPLYVAG